MQAVRVNRATAGLHPQAGDVLIERPLAVVEHGISIVPHVPHRASPTYDAVVARGRKLAERLHVDLWLTEDHTHFVRLASYRPQPGSPSSSSTLERGRPDRRDVAAREQLLRRVWAEFQEAPGLILTLSQAERLFGMREDACRRILGTLVRQGVLRVLADGSYAQHDVGW